MKPIDPQAFDRKQAEASAPLLPQDRHMIRTQMNRSDWLILGVLAIIWGGAFFFIGVAVKHVHPLTYVWLRVTIAAAAMWLFLRFKGQSLGLPPSAWGSIFLLALLNNALPFTLFGWGQTHIASGLASILNATTPIWGVVVAHFLTTDERMTPRKIAGVLLGFGGVATMIGPALLSNLDMQGSRIGVLAHEPHRHRVVLAPLPLADAVALGLLLGSQPRFGLGVDVGIRHARNPTERPSRPRRPSMPPRRSRRPAPR